MVRFYDHGDVGFYQTAASDVHLILHNTYFS